MKLFSVDYGWQGWTWTWQSWANIFKLILTYGMPSKITKQNFAVSATWWNLFDISRHNSTGAFCVWVKGSLYVSGKLPTYPSSKPTFCLKWEVSVNAGLGEG